MQAKKINNLFFLALIPIICLAWTVPADVWGLVSGAVNDRITKSNDDAEEKKSTGDVTDGSSDLELGYEASEAKIVGLRFPDIQIPRGATITRAYIQFYCDEVTTEPASFYFLWGRVAAQPMSIP